MKTTSIALSPYYEEFIKSKIQEGRYNNASELLRAALRLLIEEEARYTNLKNAIVDGIDSGICEDFDPQLLLESLKSNRANV